MAATAEKLEPTESPEERELVLPPLPKGDMELEFLEFAHSISHMTDRLGSSLQCGLSYNARGITGQVMRIAVKPNGVAYMLIRCGGTSDRTGFKILGGKLREVLVFSNGMHGAVRE